MESSVDVALFIDRGVPQTSDGQALQHIFLPFFGGPDDRLALSFVVQLCMSTATSATVVRFTQVDSDELTPVNTIEKKQIDHAHVSVSSLHGEDQERGLICTSQLTFPDTVYAARDTQTQLASETADNLLWERYSSASVPEVADALKRITFQREVSSRPVHSVIDAASKCLAQHTLSRPMVIVGRSRRLAVATHASELQQLFTEHNATMPADLTKTLGDLGAAFVAVNANANLLILQAAP